jgi:hypothetical protein
MQCSHVTTGGRLLGAAGIATRGFVTCLALSVGATFLWLRDCSVEQSAGEANSYSEIGNWSSSGRACGASLGAFAAQQCCINSSELPEHGFASCSSRFDSGFRRLVIPSNG